MASEWPLKTIAECASPKPYSTQIGPFGKALMADEYKDFGVPVLRGVNVNRGRFHDDDFVFIDEATADRLSKFESFPGDVLLVHKGTLGQIGIMPKKRRFTRYIMGNSMMRVASDPEKLLPDYLYYWLVSSEGQHYLFSRVSQVGVPQIQTPLTTLRQATLPVPPLDEQRAIAHILGTLEDKIELNRRMNETLEAIARAIFKSWFVDFDPVRAKVSGEPPESICRRLGLTPDLLALFPDRLVDSELGEIPEGWEWSAIGDQVEIVGGGTPSTKESEYWDDGAYNWTTPKDLSGNPDKVLLRTERKITRKGLETISSGLLPAGTVLMSSRAPVGYLAIAKVPTAINQGFIAMKCQKLLTPEYALQWVNSVMDEIKQRASGTTFAEISKKNFRMIKVLVPTAKLVHEYTTISQGLYDRITANVAEADSLSEIRDSLLPKLLSGELLIAEASNE